MMNIDIAETLRSCFQSYCPTQKDAIVEAAGIFEEKQYDRRAFFVRQGFNSGKIAFVVNGIFRVFFATENGREFTKYFSNQNDLLLSSIDPMKDSRVNIQAITPAVVVQTSHEAFLHLCSRCREMAELRGRIIDAYLAKKEAREINLLSNDAKTNYAIFQKEYAHLRDRIPQYYVASYLGITPTQLSRLKKAGVIDICK